MSKKTFWSNFQITDRESCERAIRNGGVAGFISAGITAIFSVIGFFIQSSNADLNYLIDPWTVVDAIFVFFLSIFIFRKSRVASTLIFIYFTVSKIIIWIEIGVPKSFIISIIFFLYFTTAMRGTYIWHKKYRGDKIQHTSDHHQSQIDVNGSSINKEVSLEQLEGEIIEKKAVKTLSCSLCDFTISEQDFAEDTLICPDCGSVLSSD